MGTIITIASGKGGVGKTTVTAALGATLAKRGHRVLLADADFGLRDLDMMLGAENDVLFDALDVWKERCFKEDALLEVAPYLQLLPANQQKRWEDIGRKGYMKMIKRIANDYDYVLVDAPAGVGRAFESILKATDRVLIVSEPFWMSLRDAQRVMQFCNERRLFDYALVLNQMPNERLGGELSIDEVLDVTGSERLGSVLPASNAIRRAIQEGRVHKAAIEDDFGYMLEPLADFIDEKYWADYDIINRFAQYLENQKTVGDKEPAISPPAVVGASIDTASPGSIDETSSETIAQKATRSVAKTINNLFNRQNGSMWRHIRR